MTRKSLLGLSSFAIVAVSGAMLWRSSLESADRMTFLEDALEFEIQAADYAWNNPDVLARALTTIDSFMAECDHLSSLGVPNARRDAFLNRARSVRSRIAARLHAPTPSRPQETPMRRQFHRANPTVL